MAMGALDLDIQFGNLDLNNRGPGHFHGDWVDASELTPDICDSIIRSINIDYQEATEDESEMLLAIDFHGIEYLSDMCTSAFLQKVNRNQEQAVSDLRTAERLVEKASSNSIIDIAYLDGISFVLGVLSKYINDDEMDREEDESDYNRLGAKSEAAIIAAKDYFFERLPGSFWKKRNNEPNQMITLDPDNPEWYLRVYKQLWHKYRDSSRDNFHDRTLLLEQMKNAILKAMLIDGDNPRVLMHNIECLRELGKRPDERGGWPVECAGEVFSSRDELKRAVMNKINKILVANSSVQVMLSIAMSICIRSNSGVNMTVTSEEVELAKRLLDEAFMKCPNSGRVLHKHGLYTLIIDGNIDRAIEYFRDSLREWPHFYSALVDLIMTLMSRPEDNKTEIMSLINKSLENNLWTEKQKSMLKEYKGTLLFMTGQYTDGIKLWQDSGCWSPGSVHFRCQRYKWPRDKLNVHLIYEEIEAMVALEQSNSDEMLQSMREDVRNALERTQRVSMMRGRGAGGNSWRIRDHGEGHGQLRGRGPFYQPRRSHADQDDNWRN